MSDLKTTFIQRTLSQYMQYCIATMRVAMKRAGVGVTDEAIVSLAYEALAKEGGGFANLSFENVLRFVDMGVGRGHPLGGLKSTAATLQALKKTGPAGASEKGRKPKKIYSKIVYGKLTWLQGQLLYGYTEETIAMLKAEFNTQNS